MKYDNTEKTNKRPVKTAGYSSVKLHAKRDRKRREAEARNKNYRLDHPELYPNETFNS